MRRASVGLFRATGAFLAKFLVVVAALGILYLFIAVAWPAGARDLVASLTSPVDIVVASVVLVFYAWGRNAIVKKLQRA